MRGDVSRAQRVSARAGERVAVEVTGLASGGEAVGRQVGGEHDGRVTFIPFAAPGERVVARVLREKSRLAWAALESVERPAPERVAPPCPLFGRCGGCQWQHVTSEVQREAKRRIVERALGYRVPEVRAVGPPYGYRDRARMVVGRDGAVGFRAWGSHAVIDVPACPLLGPALAEALPKVRAEARSAPPGTEVALQAGRDGVAALVGARPVDLGGPEAPDLAEPGSPPLRVPPGAFAQVGAAANAALVTAVMEAVGESPGPVLELHAGSGNFTRHLVARAPTVTASDADRAAVERGRRQVPGADWRGSPPWPSLPPFDTVLVDPPREGLDPASLAIAASASRVVYVSCDPQTLGRDVRRLAPAGLSFRSVVALDLMPQTYHVEVVALLEKG
jgi:23S rRNA (uracil1939-C5)-methyltransferase